jgi:hypothetical protein
MRLREIQVESYAGSKADEAPRQFCLDGVWTEVVDIIDRWHQVESLPEWPRADYFKVVDLQGKMSLLKHDLEDGQWYLGRQW